MLTKDELCWRACFLICLAYLSNVTAKFRNTRALSSQSERAEETRRDFAFVFSAFLIRNARHK